MSAPVSIPLVSSLGRKAAQKAGMNAFPLLVDVYVFRSFISYFLLVLAGFVLVFDAFTLFDLLADISKNHVSSAVVLSYLGYLVPLLVYQLTPLAALVAVLVTLGVMAKNNEVVAFKASGVSLYRLNLPLLLTGSAAGRGYVRNGQHLPALCEPHPGCFAQPDQGPARANLFSARPSVDLRARIEALQLRPFRFRSRSVRRLERLRARSQNVPIAPPHLRRPSDVGAQTGRLDSGKWLGARFRSRNPHSLSCRFEVLSLSEISEPPSYFRREVRQYDQMNWHELRNYIAGLRQAGFDASRLTVQWHMKFAFPMIAVIIIFLSAPFGFLVGTRGAIGGLALAVAISVIYWSMARLFEAMGAVGQLPPLLAGWSPDAIFLFLGAYCFLKMPT